MPRSRRMRTATTVGALAALAWPAAMAQPSSSAAGASESETGAGGAARPADAGSPSGPDDRAGGTSGWFRVDTDGLGTQLWFGATHSLGSIDLASDVYLVGSFAELDIGPSFSFGDISLTAMVGLGFDFSAQNLASLIAPQLFTIYDSDALHVESWIQLFVSSIFDDDGAQASQDSLYVRTFVLYKATGSLAVGPQVELSYRINREAGMFERAVISLPIGGRVNLGYDENNTLGIFLGYDTRKLQGSDGIAGRFTFVRSF